ncbi:hypothetical protein A7K94_0216225 [Modestobacter sp. VKM Ac-2676]|nr:hypothetical protein A7K94_0216225 [Modestobacter sp. VKM Ac-2676]
MNSTSTRAERRAQRLEDPRFEWARTPAARRRLVAAMVVLLVAETACLVALETAPLAAVIAFGVIAVLFVFCLGSLKAGTSGVEELPAEVLDERQWQVRGEAYARAYRIGFGLLTALLALVALWLVLDWPNRARGWSPPRCCCPSTSGSCCRRWSPPARARCERRRCDQRPV